MEWKELQAALAEQSYIASDELVVAIQLALSLERPLLLEGSAGVGKTELARALSQAQLTKLIRLQCYEGLDSAKSIYEWNYQRQLISIRAAADDGVSREQIEKHVFSKDFLLERPLLMSITQDKSPVLLIDEIDRADEEFEAFFETKLIAENIDTIAGVVISEFTRLPNQMDEIICQGFKFKVLKTDSRRIHLLEVERLTSQNAD